MSHHPGRDACRLALKVWAALLSLLAVTCASAFLPLGAWNSVVNLAIALAKTLLVAIFFMQLRAGVQLLRLIAAMALFTLALLFVLSGTDYTTRTTNPAAWQAPRQLESSADAGRHR